MDLPGYKNLGNADITTAQSGLVITSGVTSAGVSVAYLDQLAGMRALGLQTQFVYVGAGGTSAKLYVQGSIDQGATWFDIACFAFTTASLIKTLAVEFGKCTSFTRTDGTLTDDTVANSGVVPPIDRARAKLVTVGTYDTGTQIAACGQAA